MTCRTLLRRQKLGRVAEGAAGGSRKGSDSHGLEERLEPGAKHLVPAQAWSRKASRCGPPAAGGLAEENFFRSSAGFHRGGTRLLP